MESAMTTPGPKLVRWAFNASLSSPTPSSPERTSSSTLSFVSSQLVAHGFVRPPGLVGPLSQLQTKDQDVVVKCLMSLLEQRITDMERTEELTTRLNTLSYDHERLIGMHKTAKDHATHAQRETESTKSKHAATTNALSELQATHKVTVANLQRAQSALQFTRQTAQNEIKRKEKEVERIMDRWNKLSNEQTKLSSASSGMRCTNLVPDPAIVVPRGSSVLENSLAELKSERDRLVEQSQSFRSVIISLASGLDKLVRQHRSPSPTSARQAPVTDATLFPPSVTPWKEDPEHALATLNELLLATSSVIEARSVGPESDDTSDGACPIRMKDSVVHQRLLEEIQTLKAELEECRKSLEDQRNGALDAFLNNQRLLRGAPRPSAGGGSPIGDATSAEKEDWEMRLMEREKALEEERSKLTAAAIELGKERGSLASARLDLQEEKRAWRLKQVLEDMSETPAGPSSSSDVTNDSTPPIPSPAFVAPPAKSSALPSLPIPSLPHVSVKQPALKVGLVSKRHHHKSRSPKKSTTTGVINQTKLSPRRKLIRPLPSETETITEEEISEGDDDDEDLEEHDEPAHLDEQNVGTRAKSGPTSAPSGGSTQVTHSESNNPFDQILAQSAQAAQSLTRLTLSPERPSALAGATITTSGRAPPPLQRVPQSPPLTITIPSSSSMPQTPSPLSLLSAQERLKKNPYAPAVPSPLSRILRMSDSPALDHSTISPANEGQEATKWNLANVLEEEEEQGTMTVVHVPKRTASLAEELGLEIHEESDAGDGGGPVPGRGTRVYRTPSPGRRRFSAKEKGKNKLIIPVSSIGPGAG
ncbi:hypothetical protein BS47DRAFT_572137 [Hydnum rufescens UP504]|uniref:Afadin and alpha-actinin-binding-domain-containing protein n=1 Tax=Hydnum rufescens UP504 TaxID=1448309 RepID=A0A9P6B3Q2_9AGAM|nr:hypothetical protein BS47DRAFT_572137 [Hydnum rufescens UP504]